ncbi:UNKNOWN [Stylonychia lemnae]|uniref:Uncharacterized protein n=1 Tax=Stylonychia lemnae TaxID=5949 RepID=A0A077ZZX9_STYLE|nr:UNKNOWN [Stylonychia lemnae]|eukprot:CDW75455.1 UNKNOWN [Stylonychia lemnae]
MIRSLEKLTPFQRNQGELIVETGKHREEIMMGVNLSQQTLVKAVQNEDIFTKLGKFQQQLSRSQVRQFCNALQKENLEVQSYTKLQKLNYSLREVGQKSFGAGGIQIKKDFDLQDTLNDRYAQENSLIIDQFAST